MSLESISSQLESISSRLELTKQRHQTDSVFVGQYVMDIEKLLNEANHLCGVLKDVSDLGLPTLYPDVEDMPKDSDSIYELGYQNALAVVKETINKSFENK